MALAFELQVRDSKLGVTYEPKLPCTEPRKQLGVEPELAGPSTQGGRCGEGAVVRSLTVLPSKGCWGPGHKPTAVASLLGSVSPGLTYI